MKILVVEDDLELNQSIVAYLSAQHYLCESATDYNCALAKIEEYDYDCVVVDLNLPGGDGLQLIEQLKRNNKDEGVIILSARNELNDKIRGINLGADDYLTKPFHLSELSVRIAAIIRRKSHHGLNNIRFEEIEIDIQGQNVSVHGMPLQLTKKEYDLLLYFVINKSRVLSKNAIASHIWGDEIGTADNHDFLYTHMKNLRRKLEQAGAAEYIHSVYGMGYRFSIK